MNEEVKRFFDSIKFIDEDGSFKDAKILKVILKK